MNARRCAAQSLAGSMLVHLHHSAALHFHSITTRCAGSGRADRKDGIFHIHSASFLEFELALTVLPCSSGCLSWLNMT